jgi:hypothetical protein
MKKKKHYIRIPRPRPARAATFLCLLAVPVLAISPVASSPAPVSATPQEDIRDIRPPIHIPAQAPWLPAGAITAGLTALGYGVWRWTRKGTRTLLPYEVALAKLDAARALMQPGTAREFSIAVSEVVRTFIEQCFPVRAAHRTTDEFLHELANQADSPLAAHSDVFEDFLNHCDLAKFAQWQLSVNRMDLMLASARAFVLSIGAPSPAAVPVAEPALTPS